MNKSQASEPQGPLLGRHILVVDDEPDQLTFIAAILEDHGATVLRAADGESALELARREHPDLITLDLAMPGRSGVDVFEELRGDVALQAIPVCIITGRPELRRLIYDRMSKAPPEGYLNKPVDRDGLLLVVRKMLEVPDRKQRKQG